ncbi:HMA2 domain-containing protein [Desulfonatronovibrio magnus]|uniref:HMA2 domain-containing protein n=1 Tax=Desulfonatronovibrio magnus TaxID=698827 RepID=UPI0005EAFE1B|nr:hypothetical protein [Desulfonatronovibrio magnus]
MLVSAIPGRLRVRHDALQFNQSANAVQSTLSELEGIQNLSLNTRTCSALIEYDPRVIDQAVISSKLAEFLPDQKRSEKPRTASWNKGRVSKRGMLACLGAALIMAVLDEEDAHIMFGIGFLGFLGLHLNVHSKRVLK